MGSIKIGDYVIDNSSSLSGIVISEAYERQHQYLERELYYNILVHASKSSGKIIKVHSYDCTLLQEIDNEDGCSK